MRCNVLALLVITILFPVSLLQGQQDRDPVNVGVRVCASCHEDSGMDHQFSKWLLSKHAKAYAALSMPEASEIAELSGIPGEPQQAVLCLGCHATAADSEDWERDEGFHLGKPTELVIKHIRTGDSPRGILVTPDGATAFIANALDDSRS